MLRGAGRELGLRELRSRDVDEDGGRRKGVDRAGIWFDSNTWPMAVFSDIMRAIFFNFFKSFFGKDLF